MLCKQFTKNLFERIIDQTGKIKPQCSTPSCYGLEECPTPLAGNYEVDYGDMEKRPLIYRSTALTQCRQLEKGWVSGKGFSAKGRLL